MSDEREAAWRERHPHVARSPIFDFGFDAGRASRDAEVTEANDVVLAIVRATSGPGDGPSDMEMVEGVCKALEAPVMEAARREWRDLVARADAAEAVIVGIARQQHPDTEHRPDAHWATYGRRMARTLDNLKVANFAPAVSHPEPTEEDNRG